MPNMTLSPIQPNFVTNAEFKEFETRTEEHFFRVDQRFDKVEQSIADLKNFTIEGFEKMELYIDNSIFGLETRLNSSLAGVETRLNTKLVELDKGLSAELVEFEKGLNNKLVELDNGLNEKLVGVETRLNTKWIGLDQKLNQTKIEILDAIKNK